MTKTTREKWTDEQYQLAARIIETYRHPSNPRLTDWERAWQDHPEWKTQLQGDRSDKAFRAFIGRCRTRASGKPQTSRPKTPGTQTHGQAPYPEFVQAAATLRGPFRCADLIALLPRENKKRVSNACSAWVAIGWLEREGQGLYKRTATFGSPVYGVEDKRRAKKQLLLGNEAPAADSPVRVAPVEVQGPPPVPLNFCPSCGFNLMMLKAAFSVAAKHSRRQNGA